MEIIEKWGFKRKIGMKWIDQYLGEQRRRRKMENVFIFEKLLFLLGKKGEGAIRRRRMMSIWENCWSLFFGCLINIICEGRLSLDA